ncbi:uncharacterized protein LOC125024061 [Mugil cephalus]|uniref:uncharacterized protein LOC125024061 n=1 Tax=Mugil cephalus TaxID=48193 RepID=UPI001FB573D8|nr:uncharacterized protein LOC125024061 [Mugil cephalus]
MVHLCVSISDGGLRLESVQKGSPKCGRSSGKKAIGMATLRRQPRSRTGSNRQDRGSCSSTASCPVFSGPYSDQEEDPPVRRQSSPLLKGSVSNLQSTTSPSSRGSLSSLQGFVPRLPGSLLSLQGSLSSLQSSLPNLRGSFSRFKRRSLGSLDNSSPSPSDRSTSPSLQSGNGSSSDDDGSWDTNSWSSGATCLLRTPVKQDSKESSKESSGKNDSANQASAAAKAEDEIIYQNLIFSRPAAVAECTPERPCTVLRKDTGTQSESSSCLNKNAPSASSHQEDETTDDKRKFSQFLNEVTCRVLKTNGGPPQQQSILRHRYQPSPQPPPTSTPSHPPTHSVPTNTSTSASNSWYSPTSLNLQTIKEYEKDIMSSIHQWSKTLPSCKILEPGDVLTKVKGESHSHPEHNLELCTKVQAQPSTGRLYLETDIDRVRQLDELVANGTLGKERNEKKLEKGMERGTERESRILWDRNGGLTMEKGKEREKRKESAWERDKGAEKGKEKDKEREKHCWEKDRMTERGREKEKEKKVVIPSYEIPAPQMASSGRSNPCPVFSWPEGFPRMSYRSTSLPRPVNITESDGEMQHDTSSFHDHKDDLRKRLSYTTHKLEMVETEFDSTRQYLETELRRAQEELEKFTEKLRRIQSSYAALQRINQDLEDKMHRTSQHHEEEKRALSREIIVLNNHLMEAKITINKLREDNDLYRKDCNLAAQLLQCSKSHYRAHKMSELPLDFQERISSHMEKHNRGGGATMAMCHSNYSDAVPTAIIAKVLEKPEPGSSCPVTRSPSPQPQDGDFLTGTGSTDHLNRRISYKSSDLYCSDTALYCPERWQDTERRQSVDLHGTGLVQLHAQNSTDSNPDEEAFHSGSFSHHEPPSSFHHDEFGTGSLPASSSYSSFSLASDEKGGITGGCGRTASSTLSSSHQGLYMDWRDGGSGDYERKSMSSYEKDSPSFPKSHSIQHMVIPRSPQKGTSPAYTRTASCFSEPYHSSSPRLASSHSMGSTTGLGQARAGGLDNRGDVQVPDDDLSNRWRQLSVEDINTFSSSYRDITGRVSPYSFSERHFAMGPSSKVKGTLYSSFQEGDDVFHSRVLDQCFAVGSPSASRSPKPMEHRKQDKTSVLYRAKDDSQDSECSLFLSGSSKDKESSGGATAASSGKKDYVNLSADSSAESLHQSSLEASSLQHYPSPRPSVRPRPSSSSALSVGPALPKKTSPRYQKFGSTGLTRKDSLTKAQLYGTLLN